MARLSSRSARSVRTFVEALDGRIQAISNAHGLLRRGAWAAASLRDLVTATVSPYQSASNIELQGEPVSIVPELAQSMALILHELATNAVKHGALSKPGGNVRISWSRIGGGQLCMLWQETGNRCLRQPTSEGFGLTVLRTAATDLGATATCDFAEHGFTYTLQGPFEIQEPAVGHKDGNSGHLGTAHAVAALEHPMSGCRILVVEDETLVALQLQGDLEGEGHQVVGPATSLKQGLTLAEEEDIDAALVDVRLGRDTSAAIADKLLARNIPFAFATGYSDVGMLPDHLHQVPKLGKPYVIGDIRRILGSLIAKGRPKVASQGQAPRP
jgi:two-component sensor histidine kinase/CheY-like chemotaxis protein